MAPVVALLMTTGSAFAQETHHISLMEAIHKSQEQSDAIKAAQAATKASEWKSREVKNYRLPDLSVSGQYSQIVSDGTIDLKIPMSGSTDTNATGFSSISPNYIIVGSASASLPVFSGFKINNAVKQSKLGIDISRLQYESAVENTTWQTINLYFAIYKTQNTIKVLKENLIRAQQRVKDFQNFLDNNIIAKNDFLQAKLQASNIQIAIEEAQTNYRNLCYRLDILMGNPETDLIEVDEVLSNELLSSDNEILQRKDIRSLELKDQIAEKQIKIAQSNYYPQVALTGNYYIFDIDKVATIKNNVMVGVGVKFNLHELYKNRSTVQLAKAEKLEGEYQLEQRKKEAKIQVSEAYQKYILTQKKNQVYEEALEQARENYRIVKDKYDNGLADTDLLLEADVKQLQAEINKVAGKADQELAAFEYLYSKGTLSDNIH